MMVWWLFKCLISHFKQSELMMHSLWIFLWKICMSLLISVENSKLNSIPHFLLYKIASLLSRKINTRSYVTSSHTWFESKNIQAYINKPLYFKLNFNWINLIQNQFYQTQNGSHKILHSKQFPEQFNSFWVCRVSSDLMARDLCCQLQIAEKTVCLNSRYIQ
jgi:hypothetical protein